MAGKNTIQILRGKVTDTNKSEKLLEGQPFYNEDKNYLTIGRQGGTASLDSLPITVRELVGYVSDSDKITNIKTNEYSLKYSNADNSLKITSPRGVDIDSGNGDVTLKRNNNSSLTLKSDSIEYANNSISASVAVNIITPSTAGFVFKDGGEGNLATVGMGKLKLNTLCDASTGAEQASVSKTGIEVTKDLKVNNVMTPAYIGTPGGRLNFSLDGDADGTLNINYSTPTDRKKINKFVFCSGNEDTSDQSLSEVVAKIFWSWKTEGNIIVANELLTANTIRSSSIASKSDNNNFHIQEDGTASFKSVTCTEIATSGVIKTDSTADNAVDASKGTVKALSFNALSDKRLKENIVEYSPNKSILDLPVYSYNFISDEKKTKKIGCLAQDLKEICPEIVKEDDKGYLSIEENKIVYLLLDEVKKLKKRVDELEAK